MRVGGGSFNQSVIRSSRFICGKQDGYHGRYWQDAALGDVSLLGHAYGIHNLEDAGAETRKGMNLFSGF